MTVLFWTLAYLLIIFNGIKYRNEKPIMMPLLSGALNLAWEINAAIDSEGYYGHVVWLALDIVIYTLNILNFRNRRSKVGYVIMTIVFTAALASVFHVQNGMLISVFTIDLIMATEYMFRVTQISDKGKIAVAVCKLLGDFYAMHQNWQLSRFVLVTGILVLLINLYYLCYCLEENKQAINPKRKR